MKACIFDLDGTLTDTLESLTYSVNRTLSEIGLTPIAESQVRSYVGNGAAYLMECALKAAGDESASRHEEAMEVYRRIFGQNCTYHVTPYEGIPELLDFMKEKGIMLAVFSNKPHRQTVEVAKSVFGKEMFAYVQGQCSEIPRKPDPEGIRILLDKLRSAKEECLYVGDSEVDIETGRAAGVLTVGVTWGFRGRQALEKAGAEYLIDKPEELRQFIS